MEKEEFSFTDESGGVPPGQDSDDVWLCEGMSALSEHYKLTREEEASACKEIERVRIAMLEVCTAIRNGDGGADPRIGNALKAISQETAEGFLEDMKKNGTGKLLRLRNEIDNFLLEQPSDTKEISQLSLQRDELKSFMDAYALQQSRLLESIKPWAYKVSYTFINYKKIPKDRIDDYHSCALIGVTNAIDRFDYSRGIRLITYATIYIKRELHSEWKNTDRKPFHISIDEDRSPGERQSFSRADTRERTPADSSTSHRSTIFALFAAAGITNTVELRMFEQAHGLIIDVKTGSVSYAMEEKPRTLTSIAEEYNVTKARVEFTISRVMRALRQAAQNFDV